MDTRVLEALSDDNRYAIIGLLADGERCVCEVSEALGISNALASHHLKKLREAGLVDTRRSGAWLYCRLRTDTLLAVADALRSLAEREPVPGSCCASTAVAGDGGGPG
jgi:ArsR family transcriptional regulator